MEGSAWVGDGFNYYSISAVTSADTNGMYSTPALTVLQAYNIDKKADDGMPLSGTIQPYYLSAVVWNPGLALAAGGGAGGANGTAATAGSSTTCYDNNNVGGAAQKYSTNQNGGNGLNCALSFRFQ